MSEPKQHHYVPTSYLENFRAADGSLWVHDKWKERSFPSQPDSILKEKNYYAQPDYATKSWNYGIEKYFSNEVETDWPTSVRTIRSGPQEMGQLYNLHMSMYALRVRVPNCRKAVEFTLQEQVKIIGASIRDKEFLERERKIVECINNALGKSYRSMNDLYNDGAIDVTIDPHKSLEAMAHIAKGFSQVISELQFHFIHNNTGIDFVASDNPIVYFPAGQDVDRCTPYQFQPGRPFEFIFPITRHICLYHNSLHTSSAGRISTSATSDVGLIARINRFVGAFADRFVVSSRKLVDAEVPTANLCPRPKAYTFPGRTGTALFVRYEMGEPLRLPKWKHTFDVELGRGDQGVKP